MPKHSDIEGNVDFLVPLHHLMRIGVEAGSAVATLLDDGWVDFIGVLT
jgi:hypothetical protein